MRVSQRVVTGSCSLALAAVTLLGGIGVAHAHQTRIDIALWGNFGTDTARCQRTISSAATLCATQVLATRQTCAAAQLAGEACDAAATDAAIQAIRNRASAMVQQVCTGPELDNLRYIDMSDATNDVVNICRQQDAATTSAIYAPAMVGGSVAAAGDDATQTCLNATGAGAAKLLRFALRTQRRSLDRIASMNLTPSQKHALIDGAALRVAHARTLIQRQIELTCPADTFKSLYGREMSVVLDGIGQRADCLTEGVYLQNAVTCPTAVCGNGMQEVGEECDDGNSFDGDGCRTDCKKTACDAFPTTYDLIQRAVFENRGCTESACHGSAAQGGLDLRADVSYENLIDVPAQTVPGFKRVDPGSKSNSLLWINLAAKTLPDQFHAPLRGMPLTGDAIKADELEALRVWIEKGGASRTASVDGVGQLLNGCSPEPKPVQIKPLPPPAPGEGVQMHMPVWTLPAKSESEVCFSSYYDFTGQIPPEFLNADGTKFRYKKVDIRQEPLSHHLIVDLYRGAEPANDPVWGAYSCKGGPRSGQSCDPLDLTFCGEAGDCATDPDPTAIACIGFGPQTGLTTLTMGGFAFAQSTTAEFRFPQQVYDEVPVKGVVLWNSHAFNLTRQAGKMEAWVNVYFPKPEEQQYKQIQIFDASKIFWTDRFPPLPLPELAPFEKMEVCHVHVFTSTTDPVNEFDPVVVRDGQQVHLFELSGHMHEHGKRFQIFRGSFTCKGGTKAGAACSPFNADMCPGGSCTEDTGRDPQQSLLYTNFVYNDPVVQRFDSPLLFSGSAPRAERALTFCGVYDNGAPPNIQDVKRRSTSPPAGTIFGISIGGPCAKSKTRCIGGPQHNQLCKGSNTFCDSEPGKGDGDCDACPLTGGFRTKDEMFILFGNFWVQ